MWVRIDDKLPRHPKILAAGRLLGKNGAGLALAVYVAADCYCAEHLTDGLIAPEAIAGLAILVRQPQVIAEALVSVNLFEREGDGYRIHDYHDYNPTAAGVKERRSRDRQRKALNGSDSEKIPLGIHADSAGNPDASRGGAGARAQDGTGGITGSSEFQERGLGKTTGPLMGSHLRCASHAAGFCIPQRLHEKLVGLCRGVPESEADALVNAFYGRVDADVRWKKGQIGTADAFRFFMDRWEEDRGGVVKKSAKELQSEKAWSEM